MSVSHARWRFRVKEWGLIAKFSQWVVVWLTVWTEFHNPSAPSEPH